MAKDLREDGSITEGRISGAIDGGMRRCEEEAAPQSHAPITKTTRGPMIRRHDGCANLPGESKGAPPISCGDIGVSYGGAQEGVVAQRHKEARVVSLRKMFERCEVHVVVVIVRHQDCMDGRQIAQCDSRWIMAARAKKTEWNGPFGPDWIDEEVGARGLKQKRRVAEAGDAQAGDKGGWNAAGTRWSDSWPA